MLASLALLLPLLAGVDALGGDHYAPHRGNAGLVRRDVVDDLAKRDADPAGGDHYAPHRVKGAGSFVVGRDTLKQRDADPAGGDHYAAHRVKMMGAPVVGRDVHYVRDVYGNVLLDERGLPITATTTVVVPMTTTNTVWVDAATPSAEPTDNSTGSTTTMEPTSSIGTESSMPTSTPTDGESSTTANSTQTDDLSGSLSSTAEPTPSGNATNATTDTMLPTFSQNTHIVLPSSVSTEPLTNTDASGTSSTASSTTADYSTGTASPTNTSSSDTSSSSPTNTSSGHNASSTGWSSDDWSSTASWTSAFASDSGSYTLSSTASESSQETDTASQSKTSSSSSHHHSSHHHSKETGSETGSATSTDDDWWSPTTTTGDLSATETGSSTQTGDSSATETGSHSGNHSSTETGSHSGNHSATETGSHSTSGTASSTSTSTSASKPSSTGSHGGGMIMGGYYADWTANVIPPEEVDFSRFDVVDYAFAEPNSEGILQFTQSDSGSILNRLVSAAHSAGKKVKLSIGGWTGSAHFSPIVASDSLRSKFVQNIVDAIKQYKLDGVDIDWEYPGVEGASGNAVSPDDTANYLVFLRELRAAVGDGVLITAATQVWPFYGSDGQPLKDVSDFAEVFDYILIMNYDIWGASSKPGPNAPLNDGCNNSEQPTANAYAAIASWTNAGFPPSKLTLGIPGYGYVQRSSADKLYQRSWPMDYPPKRRRAEDVVVKNGDGGTSDGQVNFASLVAQGALSGGGSNWEGAGGFTRNWDECSSTPWLKSDAADQIITYDDPQSINLKAQFAAQAGIRGCSIWSIDGDFVNGNWPLTDAARSGMGI